MKMGKLQNQIWIMAALVLLHTATNSANNLHFYQLKPYLYKENNQWKGIMVESFEGVNRINQDCPFKNPDKSLTSSSITSIFNFTKEYKNRTEFIRQNRLYLKNGGYLNETTIWFPALGTDLMTQEPYNDYDVISEDFIVPVVLSESLDILGRAYTTTRRLRVPVVIGVLLVVTAALILRMLVSSTPFFL